MATTDDEREAHRDAVEAAGRRTVDEADERGYTSPALRELADELRALRDYDANHPRHVVG